MSFFGLFKRKKVEPQSNISLLNLPALNEWGMLFQGNGLVLHSRFAGSLANGVPYVYLKSYPEVFELERKCFGDWIYPAPKGIYLQLLENDTATTTALVYIDFETQKYHVLQQVITTTDWSAGYSNGRAVIVFKGAITSSFAIETL